MFNQKPLHLMSIGAGTGLFEDKLIRKYGLAVDYFHAIEPNEKLLEELERTVAKWNVKYTIEKTYFTSEYHTKEKFDLILMSHCLYYIPNPAEAICSAKSFLKEDGKLLIFHQSERGVCEVHRKFLSLASLKRAPLLFINHGISIEDLSYALQRKGIEHYIREEPSYIGMEDFIEKRGSHVVSFMLQTWYENLPLSTQEEIYIFVKNRCTNPEAGTYLFQHPSAMMVV